MNTSQHSELSTSHLEQIGIKEIIGIGIMHLIILILSLTMIFVLISKTDKDALLSQKIKHFFYFISQYFLLPFLFLYLLINVSIIAISYFCCKTVHYVTFKDVSTCSQKVFSCHNEKCTECISNWFCSVCKCFKKETVQTINVGSKNNNNKNDSIQNRSNEQMVNQNHLQLKLDKTAITIKENEESKIIKEVNQINNEIKDNGIDILNQVPSKQQNNMNSNSNNMIRPPVKKPVNKSKIMHFLETALVNDNNNPVFINLINQVKDNIKTKKNNQIDNSQCNQANILGKY